MLEEVKMFYSFKNSFLTLTTVLMFCGCSSVGPVPTEFPQKPVEVKPQTPDEVYNQANSCQSDYVRPNYDTLEQQLGTARARWKAQEPDNYAFSSSSGPDFPMAYSVFVEAKQVKYARSFSSSAPPLAIDLETYSVDRIFSKVAEDLKNHAGCFDYQLEFSGRWGYPVSLRRISHGKTVFHLLTYEYRVHDFHYQDLAYNAQNRCYSFHKQPDWDALTTEFERARAFWKTKNLTSYRYKFGFQSWVPTPALQIEVKDSKLTSVIDVSTGKPPEYQGDYGYVLLEERFKSIEKRLEQHQKCESISVAYDAALGYPTDVYGSLDDEGLQDAFGGSVVSNFEIIQP